MVRRARQLTELSPLEASVMKVLWSVTSATADEVLRALGSKHRLSNSSVRTILRRLEAKQYVRHEREGKRFVFMATVRRPGAAAAAARRIVDTICAGSAQSLLIGLVQSEMIGAEELDEIRALIDRGEVVEDE